MTESEVLHDCMAWLRAQGYFVWRNNTGAVKSGQRWIKFGLKGSPDIIGWLPDGRFLGVECKKQGGILSPEQKLFLWRLGADGGVAIVAHSVNELINKLTEVMNDSNSERNSN